MSGDVYVVLTLNWNSVVGCYTSREEAEACIRISGGRYYYIRTILFTQEESA